MECGRGGRGRRKARAQKMAHDHDTNDPNPELGGVYMYGHRFVDRDCLARYRVLKDRNISGGHAVDSSIFTDTLEEVKNMFIWMKWLSLLSINDRYYPDLVYQFYANLRRDGSEYDSMVNGVRFTLRASLLNQILGTPHEGSDYNNVHVLSPYIDANTLRETFFPEQDVSRTTELNMSSFTPAYRVLWDIIVKILAPAGGHFTDISFAGTHFLYGLVMKVRINFGSFALGYMENCSITKGKKKRNLPYGRIITRILEHFGIVAGLATVGSAQDFINEDSLKKQNLKLINGEWKFGLKGM